MTLSVKPATDWKALVTASVKVSGAWKAVTGIWIKKSGVWKLVDGSGTPATLNATMQAATVSGSRSDAGSVTSSAAVLLPTGGTPPYTYAWTRVSGDTFTVTSPTAASSTFSTTLTNGQSASAVYRCTVTDSLAATASATVTVNLTSSYVAPPPPPDPPLSGYTSPNPVSGTRSDAGSVTSNAASAVPSGGTGSYSYSWSGGGCTPNSASSASTTFSTTITNGGSLSYTATCRITDTAGAWVDVTVTVNFSSTYVAPPSAPTVNLSNHSPFGSRTTAGTAVTNSTTAVVTGGVGPFTYAWTPSSDDGITPSSLTTQTVTFSGSVTGGHPYRTGTFTCTVTDAATGLTGSDSCTAEIELTGI